MILQNLLRNRIICLSLFVILFTSCAYRSEELSNLVTDGVADLRTVAFTDTTLVRLNGQWHFWEGELLSDADVRARLNAGGNRLGKVPGDWSNLGLFGKRADLVTSGTVALEVLLPPVEEDWAIRLQDAHASCELSVNGGKSVSIGRVSQDRASYLPGKGVEEVHFSAVDGKALLVMRVANFDLPHTGIWMSPHLGTLRSIDDKRLRDTVTTALTSGAMLFMGLYHVALFLLRRKDRGVLVFAIICICMAARNMIMGERLMIDLFGSGWAGWHLSYIIEHLSVHMCVALFFLFFRRIYPNETSIVAVYISVAVCGLWAFIRIFTPPMFAHRFLPLFEYFVLIAALYVIYISVRAILNRREGAPVIVIGIGILLLTVINDVLLSNRLIESVYLT
jgi:adenylate cyclase